VELEFILNVVDINNVIVGAHSQPLVVRADCHALNPLKGISELVVPLTFDSSIVSDTH